MAEREEGPEGIANASVREQPCWAANMAQRRWEKRPEVRNSGRRKCNLGPKPGFHSCVFCKCWPFPGIIGILHDRFLSGSAGGDGRLALGPDGGRLPGAAANRQFRLRRYHLDVFARPGRRRRRAVAGRGRGPHPQAQRFFPAAAARMIPKSGGRFSEKIMLKIEGATT